VVRDSRASSIARGRDGRGRCVVIPVAARRNDGLLAVALTVESEVVAAEGAIRVNNVVVVARDALVVADAATGVAADIMAE